MIWIRHHVQGGRNAGTQRAGRGIDLGVQSFPMSPALAKLLGTVLVVAFVCPAPVNAECIRLWKTLKDAARGSTLVFSGTVTESDAILVSFDVDRVWKGGVRARMTLVVMPGGIETHSATFFTPGRRTWY